MNKRFIVRSDVPKEPALIIKNQLLLSPGTWKKQPISRESILNGMRNTNWSDGKANAIIYGHRTNNDQVYFGDPSPDMWVGFHTEPKYLTLSDGVSIEGMYADYHIFDTELASKLAYGGVRAGVSEGMEFNYRTGEINKFVNSSIVNDPACKNAFLNLSEDEEDKTMMDLSEPRFLNMSDDNTNRVERGLNDDKANMEEIDAKIKALEDKNKELEKELEDKVKELKEAKESKEPKEPVVIEPSKDKAPQGDLPKDEPKPKEPEAPKVDEPKPKEEPKKEPVVIEQPKSDNKDVVEAINKLGADLKAAVPQSVAPTDPNATEPSMDDETTNKLVEQYKALHPERFDE